MTRPVGPGQCSQYGVCMMPRIVSGSGPTTWNGEEEMVRAALKIHDYDDDAYDPFTASARIAGTSKVTTQLYPGLAELRHAHPVWEGDLRLHFGTAPDVTNIDKRKISVLGHKEVTEVLLNSSGVFSNKIYGHSLGVSFGRSVTTMDPPEHGNYRMLFQKAFLPSMIASWGNELIPKVIHGLIDQFESRGSVDLSKEFALYFPFHVINELLQLPPEHRPTFHKLAFGQTTLRFDPDHAVEAGNKLRAYLVALVEERRRNPLGESDFITALANTEVDGETLPNEILISFLRQLMNAGGDTSYHGFGNVLTGLLSNPDQLEQVRNDRALVPQAIDEGLRWECPVMILDRCCNETVELAGVTIHPEDYIGVVLGSANHDEKVYKNPDAFDIHRKPRHLAFGAGAHVCIGQHLARMELTLALNALLDRLPNLRLDPDAPPPVVEGVLIRGPKSVKVVFG